MEIDTKILKKLEEWKKKAGSLPEIVESYKQLLHIQAEAIASVPSTQHLPTRNDISNQLGKGLPILKWDVLSGSIDWIAFQKLYLKCLSLIGKQTATPSKNLEDIASDISVLKKASQAWYEHLTLSSWVEADSIEERLLAAAIHCAIKPFLAVQANALIRFVDQERWRQGYCPICGGKPDFAFLDKERGARWLLCSRCDTQWLFQRLQCPYCNTQDQDSLAYFTNESGLYRLYVCERCHSYLKAIDLRQAETEILLPLERMLTIDMDRSAIEQGYRMA